MLSLAIILMTVILGFGALMSFISGEQRYVYLLLGFLASLGLALYVFLSGRMLYHRYGIFGVRKYRARALIAEWGMRRWRTRDPRLTEEIGEHPLHRADAERLERRLESFRPLFGQDWLAVALAVAKEAAETASWSGAGALVTVPDLLEKTAEDTRDLRLLGQHIVTLGVNAGCDAYRNDIPHDYARVLYGYAARSADRIDLSRYDMTRAPVGWKWSHP